ncbi:uncharacterized protein [Clytia hemisphaerica]|uniref:uncharacterized protein n=1 Tax=Clytia hemisphaerica TaxID=252671 RepID=UPI0034D596F4
MPRIDSDTRLANTNLVHDTDFNDGLRNHNNNTWTTSSCSSRRPSSATSSLEEIETQSLHSLRTEYLKQGMSNTTTNIIMNSWRESTQKQYEPALKKWLKFCGNSIDPFNPKINEGLEFLSQLYKDGANVENLNLKLSSLKLASLIAIASGGQRVQTLQSLDIKNINFLADKVIIPITSKIKQTRPSKHIEPLEVKGFAREPKLCPILHLKHYIARVEKLRNSDNLFVSYIRPHKMVSKDNISRWCKQMIANAGIDTNLYTAHSHTTSKCKTSNMSLTEILKKAGWSNARTFAKH